MMRTALLALALLALPAAAEPERPFAAGHAFVTPPAAPLPDPTPEGLLRILSLSADGSPVEGELPLLRGSPVEAPPGTIGRPRLYQYTNSGVHAHQQYNSCGQAAIATALTGCGVKPEDPTNAVMQTVYDAFPPDILWGRFGTSWKQVERALGANGVAGTWLDGEAALAETLACGHLALVMLDIGATSDEGWGPIGGHWVVVYAMDQGHVYLSNWPLDGRCTWRSFRRSWDTVMTRAFYGSAPWQHHRWFFVPRVAAAP